MYNHYKGGRCNGAPPRPSPREKVRVNERCFKNTLILLVVLIASCNTDNKNITELFPVRVDNQYGFMDRQGKLVIAPQYSQAGCFTDGLALTGTTGEKIKWGYIDKAGKYMIYPTYIDATTYSEGMAFVVSENGEPVAIDKNGTAKFTVKDAEQVQNFREGLAAYSVLTESGEQWGFVDREGKTKIAPKYTATGFFSGPFCPVANEDGKWGYINKEGALVIDCKYDNVAPFYGNVAKVCVGDKWGIIDNTGKYLITPQYVNIDIDKDKFLVASEGTAGEYKFGWVDKNGKVVIESRFLDGFPFNESQYAAVRSGEQWGYIDQTGKFTINPQFEFAFGFDGDLAPVRVKNKVGLIDKTGRMVVAPAVDDISMDYYLRLFARTSAFNSVTTNNTAPKFIGYRWLVNFYHLRFDAVKVISTEDTKTLLTQFASLTNMMADSSKQEMMKLKVGIKDCIEAGKAATVTYTTSDNPGKQQTLYLVKNGESWLVQFSKNDAMAGSKDQ